tara:strand:+ start:123 stop:845 length:723 start_codon:yes stop_codon:yes gene_type:complete
MAFITDILAFAAHPDDVEISASGTILKSISQGKTVSIIDLTQGELGTRGSIQTRAKESSEASKILGINNRVNLKLKDGFIDSLETSIQSVIEQIRRFKPEIVLANAIDDRHPDHGKAAKLVSDACYLSGLRKIKSQWEGSEQDAHRPRLVLHYIQDYYIKPDFVIDVSDFVDLKMQVIQAYNSQFFNPESPEPNTPISSEDFFDFLKGRMKDLGRPVNYKYAEGFTVNRLIGVNDLFNIQ